MFAEEKVKFLVVGAYALAAHGLPRATGDIDLWIRSTPENAKLVWKALTKFGAPLSDLSMNDLTLSETVFQIGVAPRRIDILTSIDAVQFDEAWAVHEEIEIDGIPMDDPEFREIVEEFVDRLDGKLKEMQSMCESEKISELAQLAHWLKGAGGTAGFPAFTEPAGRLEQLAKVKNVDQSRVVISELIDLSRRIVLDSTSVTITL